MWCSVNVALWEKRKTNLHTYRTSGIGLNHTTKVCDGALWKSFPPVQHIAIKRHNKISNYYTLYVLLYVTFTWKLDLEEAYREKSAMSLTSAITTLCSRTRCLRSAFFSDNSEDSEQSKQVTFLLASDDVVEASCSGKDRGSRIQSRWPEGRKKHYSTTSHVTKCIFSIMLQQSPVAQSCCERAPIFASLTTTKK